MEAAPLHSMVSLVAIFAKLAPTQQAGVELSAPHVPQDVWHSPGVLLCVPLALQAALQICPNWHKIRADIIPSV